MTNFELIAGLTAAFLIGWCIGRGLRRIRTGSWR
jgi:hypothetical protein